MTIEKIHEMKAAIEVAKLNYCEAIRMFIEETIARGLEAVEFSDDSYHAEIETEEELGEWATAEQWTKRDNKFDRLYQLVEEVADDIYCNLLDLNRSVDYGVYTNNTIYFNIEVEGYEFRYEIHNRYNQ